MVVVMGNSALETRLMGILAAQQPKRLTLRNARAHAVVPTVFSADLRELVLFGNAGWTKLWLLVGKPKISQNALDGVRF